MHKRNRITLIIEDAATEGEIRFSSSFDVIPDIDKGPQTPAELVAAKAMDYLQKYAMHESDTPAIVTPEDYLDTDVNRDQFVDAIVRADRNKH